MMMTRRAALLVAVAVSGCESVVAPPDEADQADASSTPSTDTAAPPPPAEDARLADASVKRDGPAPKKDGPEGGDTAPEKPVACTIHVAKNGSDQNPGTADAPYLHLQKAADYVKPGAVVCVHEGNYQEGVWLHIPGTKDAPIAFRNYPGDRTLPIIDGMGKLAPLSMGYSPPEKLVGWYDIEGFVVTKSAGKEVDFYNANDVHLRNMTISDSGASAIHGNVNGLVVERCTITGAANEAIRLTGSRVKFINNLFYGNGNVSYIEVLSAYPPYITGDGYAGVVDWTFAHNVFANNGGRLSFADVSSLGIDGIIPGEVKNVRIVNNIFHGPGLLDVSQGYANKTVVVRNNLYLGDAGDPIGSASAMDVGDNIMGKDPLFKDERRGDFRLGPGSPAIDKGLALPEVSTDFAGTARPRGKGYDMGPFEM